MKPLINRSTSAHICGVYESQNPFNVHKAVGTQTEDVKKVYRTKLTVVFAEKKKTTGEKLTITKRTKLKNILFSASDTKYENSETFEICSIIPTAICRI